MRNKMCCTTERAGSASRRSPSGQSTRPIAMPVLAPFRFSTSGGEPGASPLARRTLLVACGAHALHDGYTDLIYVLLPVWQMEFGLDYAALAALRGLYAAAMA